MTDDVNFSMTVKVSDECMIKSRKIQWVLLPDEYVAVYVRTYFLIDIFEK